MLHRSGVDSVERIKYLDGWRACAILAVLFAHFVSTKYLNLGRFGVELFFVLSGRLMAEILFVKKTALRTFFPRRIFRVYPALFVFCTVTLLALQDTPLAVPLSHYVSAITFTTNYSQFWIGRAPAMDHIWSLCVEEHIYIVLGVVALLHRKTNIAPLPILVVLAVAACVSGLVQTKMGMDYYAVYWRSDVRGASILMGAIAFLTLNADPPYPLRSSWLPLALIVAALILSLKIVPDPITYTIGTAALAAALALFNRSPKTLPRLLEQPLLAPIALLSYSLYLWQQPFAKMHGSTAERAAYLTAVFIIAAISFYLVERPARNKLNELLSKRSVR